jgi:tetratricopeptide (TPR) repeat protein
MGALEYSIAVVKFYCLVELGKENEAEKWVGEIEKRYPINPIDYNNFGYKLANKFGKSEYANILYKKALELDSTFMNAWTNLQYNLNLLGRKEQGLDACNEALKINPYEPISIRNKYLFLLELNRIDEMTKFIFEKSFGVFGGKINDEEHDELMANAYKGLGFNNKEHFETILKIFRNLK